MKKIVSFLLALLMCTSAIMTLVACGGDTHTHSYASEWSHDDTSHWHETTCGHDEAVEKAEHTFGEIVIDEAPTPIKKGHGHRTCSACGLTKYRIEVDYSYDPNADVTLLFDVRGGEPIAPVTAKAGTTIDLTAYTVERTDGENSVFEGWIVGGKKVESLVLTGDMVAHAAYSCDTYLGKQSVQLGKYPQTIVTDQSIIAALDQMEFGDRNLNGYYEYQGEEYARVVCGFDNAFNYERGKAYYFKVEPITWVRANGRWTTTHIIDFVGDYTLLDYLNGDFYNSLTDAEKAFIKDTELNSESTYKFYLWNVDAFASSYPYESDKKLPMTDYAFFKDDTLSYKKERFTTCYWLMNPLNHGGIDTINYYTFDREGWQADHIYMGNSGLLPCFNFDFKGIKSMTGDETVRVTFNSNGGSEIPTLTLIAEEKYQLECPEREGFDFVGWYKDAELKQLVSARDFSSNKDITLYAKWSEKPDVPDVYGITYELNGGAFDSSVVPATEFTEGTTVTFARPKKDSSVSYNYTFDGWYLESDFVTKVTSTEGMANHVKLYAKWIEEGIYFYINYELSSDESIVETEYPTKVLRAEGTIDLPTAKQDGFIFLGWVERGHSDLVKSISTLRTNEVTLTARYARAYELTWNLNGGTLENEAELPTVIYADAPTIDFTQLVPEKDGFKFLYWSVSWLSSSDSKYGIGYNETLSFPEGYRLPTTSSEPTITAVYSQVYSLTVNLMGGSVDGSTDAIVIEYARNEGNVTFQNPTKNGASLIGWSRYPDCSYEATYSDLYGTKKYFTVNGDGTTTFASSKMFGYNSATGVNDILEIDTIYAMWDTVTVSFVTNVDDLTKAPVTSGHSQSLDLTDPSHAFDITNDKKFGGWYKDEALTIKCTDTTSFYTDSTVYAKWLPKLTVTLVFEDGTQDVQYIFEGDTIESISYRVGEGQYLGGVYFDEALTNKLTYSQQNNYKPKGDITLYVVRKSV